MVGPGRAAETKSVVHHHYPQGEMFNEHDSDSEDDEKKP
jgi:hypothetical protein